MSSVSEFAKMLTREIIMISFSEMANNSYYKMIHGIQNYNTNFIYQILGYDSVENLLGIPLKYHFMFGFFLKFCTRIRMLNLLMTVAKVVVNFAFFDQDVVENVEIKTRNQEKNVNEIETQTDQELEFEIETQTDQKLEHEFEIEQEYEQDEYDQGCGVYNLENDIGFELDFNE